MLTLDDIRKQFPSARSLSDGEVIQRLSDLTGYSFEDMASYFGFSKDTPRGVGGALNDWVIEAANSAAGVVKGIGDFIAPGNRFSQAIEENIIRPGQARQSVPAQLSKRELGRALQSSDLSTQAAGVWDYVIENPALAASQAFGSFAPLGLGVKATQFGATALGLGAKAAERAALGTGAVLSGAASGGDAAGTAYDLVMQTPWETLSKNKTVQSMLRRGYNEQQIREQLATQAAREASIIPALIGGVAGATGVEKALTGGVKGWRGVGKTVAKEFGGEFAEESSTQYSGQKAAARYNPKIDPMQGVFGAGLLGGTLGAGVALPVAVAGMERTPRPLAEGEAKDLLTGERKPTPGSAAYESGAQGQLFGDLGIAGLMPPRRPVQPELNREAVKTRYYEAADALRRVDLALRDAERAGDWATFYKLRDVHSQLKNEIAPLERTVSALEANEVQPGQLGLFSAGIVPKPVKYPLVVYTPALPGPAASASSNVLLATEDGIVGTPRQFSGQQYNLFRGPTTFGTAPLAGPQPEPAAPAVVDTRTYDMFAQTPSALVPTMFNPASEPVGRGTRGAVAGNIRSQIIQQLGADADATLATRLSLDMAENLGSLEALNNVLAQYRKSLERSLKSLDRKVIGDSNILTPEEYATRRQILDKRFKTLAAADNLVRRYAQALATAYAQEGLTKAPGSPVIGQVPAPRAPEQVSVPRAIEGATQAASGAYTAELETPLPSQAPQRRVTRRRKTTAAATEATTDTSAKSLEPAVQQPQPVAAADQNQTAEGANPDAAELAKVRALTEVIDTAKDEDTYDKALDALYDLYMNTRSDAVEAAIERYVEESGPAFKKDWARAGDRYEAAGKPQATQSTTNPDRVRFFESAWPKFKQATKSVFGGKPPAEAVQRLIRSIQSAAKYTLPIDVVNKPADIGLSTPDGMNPSGAFARGRIYLFMDNIESMADVYMTLFHEMFHLGLSKIVPQAKYYTLMQQFVNDPALAPLVAEWKASVEGRSRVGRMDPKDFDALAVEETLAYLAENLAINNGIGTKRAPVIRSLLRWFANVADAVGLNKLAQVLRRLTQTEAEAFVVQTLQAIMGEAGNPNRPMLSGGATMPVKFRQGETLDGRPPTDLSKLPASTRTAIKWVNRVLKNSAQYLGTRGAFLLDLLEAAEKYLPSVNKYRLLIQRASVDKVKLERSTHEIVSRFKNLPITRQGSGEGSINWLLKQSTLRKKWAFVPDWLDGRVKPDDLDPELSAAYDALPDVEKAIVRDVFKHGHDTLAELRKAVDATIREQYKAELEAAAGDPKQYNAVLEQIEQEKAKFGRLIEFNPNWPYAPLKRFGRYAVIGRSQAFIDLAEAVRRGEASAKALDELRADPNHYYVEFVDTRLQAQKRVDDLQAQGFIAEEAERLEPEEGLLSGRDIFSAFQRLRSAAKALGDDAGISEQMDKVLSELYLVLLSETSARHAEAGRAGNRGVAGASDDMMKAFATQGVAMANFISSVRNSSQIIDTLKELRNEAKNGTVGTRGDRQMYYNEIVRRYAMGLDYVPLPLLDAALSFNSFWTLLTNASYFFVNATQTPLLSVPYMAGRFGLGRTYDEVFRAYKDIAPVVTDLIKRGSDVLSKLPEFPMLNELLNRGRIDITLQADLGSFRSGGSLTGRIVEKALTVPRVAAERVELINRITAALTAYRLAKQSGLGEQAAIDYADKVVYKTHGDYSGFNAPRFMRHPVGRVMTQFRKFQLIQLTLFYTMARDAINEIRDKDARYGAYRSLLFSLAHLMAFGGVMALPGFATLAWWAGVFDDDEPDDPEATLRRFFGEGLATLLTKGVPATLGVDLSRRIGAGDMLSLLPYTDIEPEREGYLEILAGIAGPLVGGTGLRIYEAIGHFSEGDYVKGLYKTLPSGFANAIKALDYSTRGYTARNGDTLLSPDEISFMAAMGQALGLPPTTITNAQSLRASVHKADKFFNQKAREIKNDYIDAVRKGDTETIKELIEAWMELQETRQALGYKRQPLSELLKAPRERAIREARVVAGVPTTEANREFVRRQAALMQ